MSYTNKEKTLKTLNSLNKETLMETLNIEYTDIGDGFITAKMPVNSSVFQPMKILHGGATAALAETVGSVASAFFIDREKQITKGLELSINHLKSVKEGYVYATATIIHKGKTTHLWEIKITDQQNNLISLAKLTNIVLDKK